MAHYTGRCHCGQVAFELETSKLDAALMCNCSICIKKNAIMSKQIFSPKECKVISGHEHLALYQFGDKDVNHYFCKTCGIYPFHDTKYDPGHFRVNLGCVEDIDPHALDTFHFDGKNEL